jgi:DNA repair exonuclease SbcCD ATPase subunit
MEAGALRKLIYNATKDTSLGPVDIVDANNEFKSTYDIFVELAKVWKELDDMSQAALLEKIAGKHRASVAATLLNDVQKLEDIYEVVNESEGSAMEEFKKRTESVEYHLNQLKATWQEVATDTVPVEAINNVLDLAKAMLEAANSIGILKMAVTGLGGVAALFANIKLLPYLDAEAEKISQAKDAVNLFGHEFAVTGNSATKSSKRIASAIEIISVAGKSLGKAFVWMAAIGIAVEGISKLFEYLDDKKNKVSNLSESISNLNAEIEELKSEYDSLNMSTDKTEGDERKLAILEKEIALKEKQLELEQREKVDTITSDSSEYFDGNVTHTDFSDKMLAAEKAADKYKNTLDKIDNANEKIDKHSKTLENLEEGTNDYKNASILLGAAEQELETAIDKSNTAQNEGLATLREILPLREDLVYAVENSTGAQKTEAEAALEAFDALYKEYEILYGIADSTEHLNDKIREQQTAVNVLGTVIAYANDGQKISKEHIDELIERYPELSEVVENFGTESDGAFTISKEGIEKLDSVHASALLNLIDNQIEATNRVIIESQARIKSYQQEAEILQKLFGAGFTVYESNKQKEYDALRDKYYKQNDKGQWTLKDKSKAADFKRESEAIYAKYSSKSENEYIAKIYAEKEAMDKENAEALKAIREAEKQQEQLLKQREEAQANIKAMGSTNPDDGDGPGSGDKDSKKADVWDKYAHALAKANDEIERYNRVCEITKAKLDNNQSIEERNLDLISQEIQLYDELIANTQAKYKIVNDTLWAQQQGLQQLYAEASKHMGISAEEVAGLTDAELEAFIELKLDEDKANDQKIAHLLNGIVDMRQNVHDLHIDWLALKSDILELKNEQINVRVNFQNDIAEKFDEARVNSESLLDILEEIEGTEGQRLSIIESLINSYDTELNSTMQMYKSTGEELANMLKDGLIDTDQYNNLLKEANRLEEHGLEVIKEQHDMRLKQLEVEKQRAIANAEASIYGEEGKDAWEKSRQREIDRLQNQLDALEEDTSEADYLEQLSEKEEHIAELEEKLANLRNQKTIQQLKQQEDGSFQWEYVEDQRAINETMEELEDARNDLQKTKDDKALQDQKDAIQDRIDSIEDEIDSKQEQYDLELEQINAHYEAQKAAQEQFTQEQIDLWLKHVTDVRQALDTLETQTRKGLDEVTSETAKGMSNLQDAYNKSFINITSDLSSFVDAAIREFNRLEAARRAAAEEAASMVPGGGSTDGSHANGLKFVESNNYIARLHYGERVLTRQEASQYNELEDDIKSGKLQSYFNSLQEDTALSISNVAATTVAKSATVPTVGSAVTSFVIEHLELPQVKDPTDFAAVINEWARGEFGGLAQKARIIPAR